MSGMAEGHGRYASRPETLGLSPGSGFICQSNLLCLFFISDPKPDGTAFRRRRRHQLADGIKDHFELGIVFSLQGFKFTSQFSMRSEHLSQADKSAHDLNIDLDCAFTPKDAGKHRHPLLGEGERQFPTATPT